jgi:hypothetical protein
MWEMNTYPRKLAHSRHSGAKKRVPGRRGKVSIEEAWSVSSSLPTVYTELFGTVHSTTDKLKLENFNEYWIVATRDKGRKMGPNSI